jgi:hypothetical protein
MNVALYVQEPQLIPCDPWQQFIVEFVESPEGVFQAEISIQSSDGQDDKLLAVLREGTDPGWCLNAQKDGPVAKSLIYAAKNGLYISVEIM